MRKQWGLGLLVLVLYLSSGTYETSGDVRTNEYIAVSIAQDFDVDVEEFYEVAGGHVIQRVAATGHTAALYPILTGIVASPFFVIPAWFGVDVLYWKILLGRLAAAVIATGAVVMFYYFLKNLVREKTAWWFALLFGLGTHMWSIASRGLWQHGTTLLFMNLSLYFMTRASKPWLFWSGLSASLAVWTRPSSAIFFVPVFFYIAWKFRRETWKYIAGGVVAGIPLALYSWAYLGSVFTAGQLQTFIYGNFWQGVIGSIFSPSHGLFLHAPIFIFSFIILVLLARQPKQNYFLLSISCGALLLLAFYSSWYIWWGGWTFGYRMLLEMTPALIALLAVGYETYRPKLWLKFVFIACLAWTLAIELIGVYAWPCVKAPPPYSNDSSTYWRPGYHPFVMCANKATFADKGKYLKYYYDVVAR